MPVWKAGNDPLPPLGGGTHRAANPMTDHGRVTTPFGAQTTAAEVVAGVALAGRRAVVTGG